MKNKSNVPIKKKKIKFINCNYILKFCTLIIIFLLTHKIFEQNGINLNKKNLFLNSNNKYEHFCCFCAMGKKENLYSRELISYYMNIGVDKFIFGDNNFPETEKLADVLQDYIDNGIVDILDLFGSSIDQAEFYDKIYEKYKNQCAWLTFFDFDEYLVMYSGKRKKVGLKKFLSNPNFNKCEAIQFNWLIYDDNGLVYYDKRTSIERFTKPIYDSSDNKFVKSIIRGNINKKVFIPGQAYHQPNREIKLCNSLGEKVIFSSFLSPPIYKNAYLMHFITRTAEEYVEKIRRGHPGKNFKDISKSVDIFFQYNEFSQEKLNVFENQFERVFEKYHNKS